LIYCGDVFGELDKPGCAESSIVVRAAETEGITRGQSTLGSRLLSNAGISPKF